MIGSASKLSRLTGALIAITAALTALPAPAQQRPQNETENEYYRLTRFPMQERIVLEGGALEFLPDGKLAVATRRGEIYFVDQPLAEKPDDVGYTLFASGLHEVLGLAYRDGWLYCV